jgi:hypothetical protein
MGFTIGKKFIFLILALLFVTIFILNISSNDTTANNEKNIVTNSNIETKRVKQEITQMSAQASPALQKKIVIEKKKLQDAKILHENILKSREKYLTKESQQRSKYLSYSARYKESSSGQVEQKFKSIKSEKERVYRQKFEQYNTGKRYEERNQVNKRAELEQSRLKALTKIQQTQLMNQKYKQGEEK